MKKRTLKFIVSLILAFAIITGTVSPSMKLMAASKETKQLKKLQKAIKKKKKLTESYKTELGRGMPVNKLYYLHNIKITQKNKKIIFYDNIKCYSVTWDKPYVTYNIKMEMKVGNNKTTKINITDDLITPTKYITTIKPSTYKYGIKQYYTNTETRYTFGTGKKKNNAIYLAMRCWNDLISKNAKVSMKSIGFKKFKVIKDITNK